MNHQELNQQYLYSSLHNSINNTNLFRSLRHSSVVSAGSRDIDNDKLHNYIRGERTRKKLLHRDRLNKIFTFTIWSEGVSDLCLQWEKNSDLKLSLASSGLNIIRYFSIVQSLQKLVAGL